MPVNGLDITSSLGGRVLAPLIDFDFIIDTDFGLIKFIRENYQDDRAFNLEILNKSDREILSLLYTRSARNPLSIISTEENLKDIDDLYKSFFDNFKEEILDLSIIFSHIKQFITLIVQYGHSFGIAPIIAVTDKMEKEKINLCCPGVSIIYKNDKNTILSKDPFYIKDYTFFTNLFLENSIAGKKIYILPLKYSIDYFNDTENRLTMKNEFAIIGIAS